MRGIILFILVTILALFLLCEGKDKRVASEPILKIMTYNIRTGRGMDNVLDFDRTAEVIKRKQPQIVALQELDSATQRSQGLITGEELAQRLGMHFVYAPAIDFDGGSYGIGLLSKEQPLSNRKFPLPGADESRCLLLVEFSNYNVAVVHLSLDEKERIKSCKLIIDSLNLNLDKPTFICGDFNDEPESQTISYLMDKTDLLSDNKLPTYPADTPNVVIDYVFVYPKGLNYSISKSKVIEDSLASDHRPVYVELVNI